MAAGSEKGAAGAALPAASAGSGGSGYGTVLPVYDEAPSYDFGDVADGLGMRWYHVRLLVLHWLASSVCAAVVSAAPLVMKDLRKVYGVDHATSTLSSTGVQAGALFGVLLFGRLFDAFGRRTCLAAGLGALGLLSALHLVLPVGLDGWQFAIFVALRVALGVFFGAVAGLHILHLLEFVPTGQRGLMNSLSQLGWSFGAIYVFGLAHAARLSWRPLLACSVPLSALVLVALCFAHESPRWLYVAGQGGRGRAVLEAVHSSTRLLDAPDPQKGVPMNIVVSGGDESARPLGFRESLHMLFGARLRRTMVCAICIFISVGGCTYGAGVWMPEILRDLEGSKRLPYMLLILGEVASLVGTVSSAVVMDHAGRRLVLVLSCFGFCVGMVLLPHCPGSVTRWTIYQWTNFVNSYMWAAAKCYAVEALPTNVRGTGNAVIQLCGRSAGMILPPLVGLVLQAPSDATGFNPVHLALYLVGGFALGGAAAASAIPQETANLKLSDT